MTLAGSLAACARAHVPFAATRPPRRSRHGVGLRSTALGRRTRVHLCNVFSTRCPSTLDTYIAWLIPELCALQEGTPGHRCQLAALRVRTLCITYLKGSYAENRCQTHGRAGTCSWRLKWPHHCRRENSRRSRLLLKCHAAFRSRLFYYFQRG